MIVEPLFSVCDSAIAQNRSIPDSRLAILCVATSHQTSESSLEGFVNLRIGGIDIVTELAERVEDQIMLFDRVELLGEDTPLARMDEHLLALAIKHRSAIEPVQAPAFGAGHRRLRRCAAQLQMMLFFGGRIHQTLTPLLDARETRLQHFTFSAHSFSL